MQSHLENNDVKLDALSEPNASLIENDVTLPKDIFGSYSSYLLCEVASCKPALFLFLVIVLSFSLIVIFNDRDNCVGFSIMVIVVSLLALIVVVGNTVTRPTRNQNFKIKFLVEIIERKPSGKEWGTIAYNMNQYLFDKGLWNTAYYFYSDEKCHEFFTDFTNQVDLESNLDSSTSNTGNTQANIPTSNGAGKPGSIKPDPILGAYV